jgi:hypothetical protein
MPLRCFLDVLDGEKQAAKPPKVFLIEPSKASKGHLRRAMPLRCFLDVLDGEKIGGAAA